MRNRPTHKAFTSKKTGLIPLFIIMGTSLVTSLATTVSAQQAPPAQVTVHVVKTMSLAPTISLQGDVISLNDSNISSQVEGEVTYIILPATRVKKDEVIATIDPELMELEVTRHQANLSRLQADLDYQEQELERFQRLAKTENTSKAALQKARSTQQMLKQDIVSAKANLRQAQHALAHSTIRAPFSGLFMSRNVSVGEYIKSGNIIGKLVATDQKEIITAAPIKLARILTEGSEVKIIDNEREYNLPIRTFTTVGDMTSRMINVHIEANSPDLLIGSSVTVQLPSAKVFSGAVLPRDALINRSQGALVYKVKDDMTVEAVAADVTHAIGEWVALASGIRAGDKVVTRGAERLMPGQSVQIIE